MRPESETEGPHRLQETKKATRARIKVTIVYMDFTKGKAMKANGETMKGRVATKDFGESCEGHMANDRLLGENAVMPIFIAINSGNKEAVKAIFTTTNAQKEAIESYLI